MESAVAGAPLVPARCYRFSDLTLDVGGRRLTRGTETIQLSLLNYRLLLLLVENWPNVVTRNDVIEHVWGVNRVVTPENLSQRLLTLRRALGDDASQPRYIENIRGHGYRLIPKVEHVSCDQHSSVHLDITPPRRLPNSIAVLPLRNISMDASDDCFSAGLHEEIIGQLAQLSDVNVIARTSVQRYERANTPLAEIARGLNVGRIMEGSVRHDGSRVRIAAQMIDPESGMQVWSRTYERDRNDVFKVQRDVAEDIAGALLAEFSLKEPEDAAEAPSVHPGAHALYLQALASMPDYSMSVQYLARAIELDPTNANANGLKAMIYALASVNSFNRAALGASPADQEKFRTQAATYADQALETDHRTGTAWLAKSLLALFSWHWEEAEQSCEKALHTMPNNARILGLCAWVTAFCGNCNDAMLLASRALDLDPHSAETNFWGGIVARYARRPGKAVAAHLRAVRLAPANALYNLNLAASLSQLGRLSTAEKQYRITEHLMGKTGGVILSFLSYGYERLGLDEDARRIANELEHWDPEHPVGTGGWAMAYLALGDTEHAIKEFESAVEKARMKQTDSGFFPLMALKFNVYDDARLEEPEFRDLRSRMGR